MESTQYLYELIGKCDVTLLGYTYKSERIKDEFISRLPHLDMSELDSSFDLISAFIIQEPSIKDKLKKKPYISIIKNRNGMDNKNVSLGEILLPLERESKLNKVLN